MSFSAYVPTIKDVYYGTKYVLNGDNNANYKMYADAYDDSVTNSACINDIVNLVVGKGLFNGDAEVVDFISDQDVRLLALDYKKQGQCALQVLFSAGKPFKMFYIPIENTALNVDNQMNVNGYWYCYDWTKRSKYPPMFFQKFGADNPDNVTQMLIIKRPSSEPLFSKPDWFPALRWAQDEGLMAQHSWSDIKTGFSGQKVINWSGGRGLTEEQKEAAAKTLRDKFTGIDGKRVIVSVNNSGENSIVVDNIDPPNVNAVYVNYTEEAERKILIAHSYPAILLAGSKTGFSSNADEIAVATKSVYRRATRPIREILLAGLRPVFDAAFGASNLNFKDFQEVNLDTNNNEPNNPTN